MAKGLTLEALTPEKGIVLAEVACGHEGSFDRVKQLVDVVAESDTDLIKYQIFFTSENKVSFSLLSSTFFSPRLNFIQGIFYPRKRRSHII